MSSRPGWRRSRQGFRPSRNGRSAFSFPRVKAGVGAGNGARTRDIQLGGRIGSTVYSCLSTGSVGRADRRLISERLSIKSPTIIRLGGTVRGGFTGKDPAYRWSKERGGRQLRVPRPRDPTRSDEFGSSTLSFRMRTFSRPSSMLRQLWKTGRSNSRTSDEVSPRPGPAPVGG